MEELERSQSHSGRQSGLEDEGCGLMRLLARRDLSKYVDIKPQTKTGRVERSAFAPLQTL